MKKETRALLAINTNKVMSENTRQSFKDACRRWDCEYVEITESDAPYHHAALKLHAFSLCPHNRILIIDSDTVIRSDAPNIFDIAEPSAYCAIRNQQPHYPGGYQQPNVDIAKRDIQAIVDQKVLPNPVDVQFLSENFFNSGVTVVSRIHHQEVLALAYYLFSNMPGLQWWDQIPINIAVASMLGQYHDIGVHWNYQFPRNFDRMESYIYHFAGNPSRYEVLKRVNWVHVSERVPDRMKLYNLINSLPLKVGVEVGAQKGEYSEHLLKSTDLFLHVIDAWQHIEGYNDIANVSDAEHEKNLAETVKRLEPYGHRCLITRKFSVDAAEDFADGALDFVYLDADHSYKSTLEDLNAWYPKVRSEGVLAGHDFLDGANICGSEFGVRSAVFEFLKDKKEVLHKTDEPWPSYWMIKR